MSVVFVQWCRGWWWCAYNRSSMLYGEAILFSSRYGSCPKRHPHLWSRVGSDACVGIADVSSHRRYHLLLFYTFSYSCRVYLIPNVVPHATTSFQFVVTSVRLQRAASYRSVVKDYQFCGPEGILFCVQHDNTSWVVLCQRAAFVCL